MGLVFAFFGLVFQGLSTLCLCLSIRNPAWEKAKKTNLLSAHTGFLFSLSCGLGLEPGPTRLARTYLLLLPPECGGIVAALRCVAGIHDGGMAWVGLPVHLAGHAELVVANGQDVLGRVEAPLGCTERSAAHGVVGAEGGADRRNLLSVLVGDGQVVPCANNLGLADFLLRHGAIAFGQPSSVQRMRRT